jgi:hypothetical protein
VYVSFALVTHDESFALQFIIVSSVTFLYLGLRGDALFLSFFVLLFLSSRLK